MAPACHVPRPWRYDEVVALLGRALKFGTNPSLAPVTELCEALGRPQDALAVVQVTGTNGKTSTARLTEALLRSQGRRTGLYTSPELERYPERIEVAGQIVTDEEFALAVGVAADTAAALWGADEQGTPLGVTEFELLTVGALWLFRERAVDIAVLEVGLGGRWDATSVAAPSVAVITGVGLDHTAVLGDTLEAIASEKAAIIRPASAPVLGPGTAGLEHVFLEQARKCATHARVVREDTDPSPVDESLTVRFSVTQRPRGVHGITGVDVAGVHGTYRGLELTAPLIQAANVATALAATEAALGRALDVGSARAVLAHTALPGRFELVGQEPPVVVDGSHNPQAAAVLAASIADAWPDPAVRPTVLLGVLADKDAAGIVGALAPVAGSIAVTAPDSPRALSADALADVVRSVTGFTPPVYSSLESALLDLAGHTPSGLVVTGSLTTAGQARGILRGGA